jgi:hypothetical protein
MGGGNMKLQIVHVRWVDSASLGQWEDLADVDNEIHMIDTVGLLVHQDSDVMLIASTYDNEREAINAAIWIPKCCVKHVRPLGHISVSDS